MDVLLTAFRWSYSPNNCITILVQHSLLTLVTEYYLLKQHYYRRCSPYHHQTNFIGFLKIVMCVINRYYVASLPYLMAHYTLMTFYCLHSPLKFCVDS
jgi:hypothetical protein